MLTSLLSWIFLLAIGQAIFLGVVLLSARQAEIRTANRLLAALLLAFAAIIGHAWLGLNGLYRQYPHSAYAILTIGLLLGPLLYLYLGSILFDRPLTARSLPHFLPFVLATLAMAPFYLQSAEAKLAWMRHRPALPWYIGVAALAKLIFSLVYFYASYHLIGRVELNQANTELVKSLKRLMMIWLVGGILSIAAFVIELFEVDLPISADAVGGIALMFFVYATAFFAMRLPLSYRPQKEAAVSLPLAVPKPRYENSLLSEDDRVKFLTLLNTSMEQDEVFRNGELRLEELAALVAMTSHELSQLINESCGANFQEYLNQYRVEALKKALHDPLQSAASILDLALASGFNSKSALNRAFKRHTGLTPSEFRSA